MTQHATYRKYYEEGCGENDIVLDLLHFEEDENWLGSLVCAQPYDLDYGLNEGLEAFDVGGRHLGSQEYSMWAL